MDSAHLFSSAVLELCNVMRTTPNVNEGNEIGSATSMTLNMTSYAHYNVPHSWSQPMRE